jgi:spermidine synthase/MFS family permease
VSTATRPESEELPVRPAPADLGPAVGARHAVAVGFAVFVSGAVLLGLEIAASRVVAPYFGNSLFVWGALIGVVLAGLSAGYWAGGALADRLPASWLLLSVMASGALLVLAIPFVDETILEWVVSWDPGPRLNPLVAAIALFGVPSVVFAMVTPIAVRLLARSVAHVGRTAGRLFAVSTAGSIAGTFATAFFLIPEFGTEQLLGQAAAALLAGVALVALVERMPIAFVAALAATVGAGAASVSLAPEQSGRLEGAAAQNWSPLYRERGEVGADVDHAGAGFDVVFRRDTQYHGLAVVDDGDSRYLRFDNSFQSGMWKERPYATRFEYTDYFNLGLAYNPDARRVLFIGLGGGSTPKRFWRDFPQLDLQVVELDPVVRDVAYRYFELPRSPRLRVEVEDGRRYLSRTDERWDLIFLDAYYADSIPFHMATAEFVELVQSRLSPGGVVVANVIGSIAGPSSRLFRSFVRTYRAVFPTVLTHPVVLDDAETDDTQRNLMLVATESARPQKAFLQSRWEEIRRGAPTAADLTKPIRDRHDELIPTRDVPILTDDYAPTDALLLLE